MKTCYELKNPRKNPYAERMKNGYTIIIDRNQDPDTTPKLDEIKSHSIAIEQYRRGETVSHDN
ncbi:MAG: hypothetical protein FWC16_00635 [Defluviitaleaceae bacterium]|nr:hypothetical protein [Defluviitaleaceae bacterium]MCL2273410.1 hypothetical protein [Defluviitaleaceae bacterium]